MKDFPSFSAFGGGVSGCAIAYHLALLEVAAGLGETVERLARDFRLKARPVPGLSLGPP